MNRSDIVDEGLRNGTFPGIVIVVRKNGSELFSMAKGERQIYPGKEEMTKDTVFDLASLTKGLASTVVSLSVFEKEGISPCDNVGKFIPEIATETAGITLHQLFTHTSGLPPIPEIFRLFKGEGDIDRGRALDHLYSLTPVVKPGTEVIYSCTGYILLTRILERITGRTLSDLFTELVLKPGDIDQLMFNPPAGLQPVASTEYCPWRKRWLKGEVHDENSHCFKGEGGNAGLFGSASSVMKLLGLFSNKGYLNGNKILSEKSMKLMTTCQTPEMEIKRSYGFLTQNGNTMAGTGFGPEAFGHTGFTGTSVWIDPVRKMEFVVLTNRVHLGRETNGQLIIDFRKKIHSALVKEAGSSIC